MANKLFSDTFITQKYIQRYGWNARVRSWLSKKVHIYTNNGVWREDARGYTYADSADAWVLPFEEAVEQIAHCGPEKLGRFILAKEPKVLTTSVIAGTISDEDILRVHGNADFGDKDPREVVDESVLKIACGYGIGSTARSIVKRHGLAKKNGTKLTRAGKRYLWNCFNQQ